MNRAVIPYSLPKESCAVGLEQASRPAPTTVDTMTEVHWPEVRAIYQSGIDTGHATFATAPPATWAAWQQDHLNDLSLVALRDTTVVGWASLAAVSGRCVYAGVAEVSVYIAPDARGRGVGRQLLGALIERSETNNLWTLQAGIFPENHASVALHRAVGFEPVGLRCRLGKMEYGPLAGRWRDVLLLERRSARVGAD
jgi:L-amino acid N-acyltransferase YncA